MVGGIYYRIRRIIETARKNIGYTINTDLRNLSERLSADFGKGFDESNLRNIWHFYLTYQKCDALRHELSWAHYRILWGLKIHRCAHLRKGKKKAF